MGFFSKESRRERREENQRQIAGLRETEARWEQRGWDEVVKGTPIPELNELEELLYGAYVQRGRWAGEGHLRGQIAKEAQQKHWAELRASASITHESEKK